MNSRTLQSCRPCRAADPLRAQASVGWPPQPLPLVLDGRECWPHPAWAGAGAHPAPQQFPGTRTSGQPQVVLDTQPLS
ncbi:hypothetical protein FD754_015647 [Muntiacus muntjak]|uniref:Uncharacterized protein n=1 Tax=Muntiacus muntjak TaxID=9888 RepID=A0A5N3VN76_MUNMU|nr:hypothetical protein FD754_015647 [Muntiacus muntjak]